MPSTAKESQSCREGKERHTKAIRAQEGEEGGLPVVILST